MAARSPVLVHSIFTKEGLGDKSQFYNKLRTRKFAAQSQYEFWGGKAVNTP